MAGIFLFRAYAFRRATLPLVGQVDEKIKVKIGRQSGSGRALWAFPLKESKRPNSLISQVKHGKTDGPSNAEHHLIIGLACSRYLEGKSI